MNLGKWIVAARLRTLPLSLSAVLAGCLLGIGDAGGSGLRTALLAAAIPVTAVFLQILSNFANDYGDALSGADGETRVGPRRALQSGEMTMAEMRRGLFAVTAAALVSGTAALALAFPGDPAGFLLFALFGALSIAAAITYTVGLVYGYKGLGDAAVFVFFGLMAVLGSYFMITGTLSRPCVCLGAAAGFMAVMVLNVNNLRDFESDRACGKRSLVVLMGVRNGKIYHALLLAGAALCAAGAVLGNGSPARALALLSLIPIARAALFCVRPGNAGAALDPMLKRTSLGAALVNLTVAAACLL